MTDDLKLVERLRSYRPTNEWGDPCHHVICDAAASAIERLVRERDEARDYGESAGNAARAILNALGISQDPSMEPGADPRRDRIAAIIDKSYAADRDRLAALDAENAELRAAKDALWREYREAKSDWHEECADNRKLFEDWRAALAERDRLAAQVKALREGLEPFGDAADGIPADHADARPAAHINNDARSPGSITSLATGFFRRARTLLATTEPTPDAALRAIHEQQGG